MNIATDLDITNTNNPVVMTLIDWYPPAFKAGGPVKSIANMCDLLGDSIQFKVVTGSEDIDGTDLKTAKNEWVSGKSGEKILYLSNENKRKKIQHLIQYEPFSILHINGLFSFYYSILPLIITLKKRKQIKLIVSPRGMLSPSALKIKRLKKSLFLFFSKFFGLYHQVTWHATSDKEVLEIQKHFGEKVTFILAPNIPTKPELSGHQLPKQKNKLHIVSITRISPIKNLHLIFEYLKGIDSENQVKFSLYGPSEDKEYESKLKQLASELPSNIQVSFCGIIEPQKIPVVFSTNHLFILPTQGENYGHAIVEALSNGIPVLISDQTPWKNLKENKAGFELSLNAPEKWIAALQFFLNMEEVDWNECRKGSFQFAVQNYKSEQMMGQYKKLYTN
jgi:glycosyltransferase involved in cell wall biosynthesis